MIHLGYTLTAGLAVLVAVVLDLAVLRTRLLTTRLFWASEVILVFFQLVVNGVLTSLGIVTYDPRVFLAFRLAFAPVEDLGFGFALITATLSLWVALGRCDDPAPGCAPIPCVEDGNAGIDPT